MKNKSCLFVPVFFQQHDECLFEGGGKEGEADVRRENDEDALVHKLLHV